ncbi:MAG TPA: hypothetical protein VNV44_09405 [Solirubrobacteraceae bacterium]|jgi:hypothetical protein|nr:hypothetical protein [Solirubrobacteraceae bacterium]
MRKAPAMLGVLAAALVLGFTLPGAAIAKGPKPPVIKSVKFRGTSAEPFVVVKGRGLGSIPAAEPDPNCFSEEPGGLGNDFGSAFAFADNTKGWQAGAGPGDCIGVIFHTYTETEVTFTFGSTYHDTAEYGPLEKGDEYGIQVGSLSKTGIIKIK